MLAGKGQKLANKAAKRVVFVVFCCLMLVFSLTGFTFSSPVNLEPEIAVLGPQVQTYDLDALQWEFPLTLVGFGPGARTARLAEFSIDQHDLLSIIPVAQRTLTVHRLDDEISRAAFRNWKFGTPATTEFTRFLNAGETITIPVRFTFPGGQRAYHVIVQHADHLAANDTIYTSPIFIRQP